MQSPPPDARALAVGGVALWVLDPASLGPDRGGLAPLLDEDERARLAELDPRAVAPFVAGRALVRAAVAAVRGGEPRDVALDARCADCGRPHGAVRVLGASGVPPLQVSLTRSGPLVAVALARHAVGVDAVGVGPHHGLADVGLSPGERRRLARVPSRRRDASLARTWARTEAVVKAWGTGLRVDPALVDVRRSRVTGPPGPTGPRHARVVDVRLSPGVAVAVALEGSVAPRVRVRDGGALLAG